jgi:hypothetical protein
VTNCEIVVDEDWKEHPSILEIADSIPEITADPIDVQWGNTRDEATALRSFPDRRFALHVPGFPARDRATSYLGLPLRLEQSVLERAKHLLTDPQAYDWRSFCKESEGGISPRNILLKLVADSLRKGNRPALAEIMAPLFLSGINVHDADVLLRLKSGRLK